MRRVTDRRLASRLARRRSGLWLLAGPLALGLVAAATSPARAHDGDKAHNGIDQKIAELTEILKENPRDTKALRDRGYLYLMFQDEVENGLADFEKLIELDPSYEPARACEAVALYRLGNWRGSLAIVESLCAAGSQLPTAWATRAQVRHELGDDKGALADWDVAIAAVTSSKGKWPLAYTDRGRVKAALGDEKGALEDWAHALAIDSRHTETLLARARLEGEKERWDEARADLEAASEYTRGQGRLDGRSHAERARMFRRRPFLLEAEQEANTALELLRREVDLSRSSSHKAAILLEMARVCLEGRARPRLALEVLDEAEKLCPERPDLARYRLRCAEAAGDAKTLAAAKEHLELVARAKLPDGVAAVGSVGSGG